MLFLHFFLHFASALNKMSHGLNSLRVVRLMVCCEDTPINQLLKLACWGWIKNNFFSSAGQVSEDPGVISVRLPYHLPRSSQFTRLLYNYNYIFRPFLINRRASCKGELGVQCFESTWRTSRSNGDFSDIEAQLVSICILMNLCFVSHLWTIYYFVPDLPDPVDRW